MGTLSRAAKDGTNAFMRRFPSLIQFMSGWDVWWFMRKHDFEFDGKAYPLFVHQHNCGWPPGRMTERCVELALADGWLNDPNHSRAIEIGAVTPYYWPNRVKTIIDPGDDHPLVTARTSMLDLDLTGEHILSISTFEHIGNGEYGLAPLPEEVLTAFDKLFREAEAFLVTVPMGYNPTLDKYLARPESMPSDVSLKFLIRSPEGGNLWREADRPSEASSHYGQPGIEFSRGAWANTVAVFQRRAKTARPQPPQ